MRTRCDMNDKLTVTSKLQLLFMKLHLLEVVCEAVLRTWRICTSSRCQHICDINNDLNNTRARFRSFSLTPSSYCQTNFHQLCYQFLLLRMLLFGEGQAAQDVERC